MATTMHHLRLLSSALSVPLRTLPSRSRCIHKSISNQFSTICFKPLPSRISESSRPLQNLRRRVALLDKSSQSISINVVSRRLQSTNAIEADVTGIQGIHDGIAKASFEESPADRTSFFPERTSKSVAYWLFGMSGLVFGMVVLGGLTRLTESGLSITDWKPVTGIMPPMDYASWEAEFAKYKDSPEYRILNANMELPDYKFIYYMEWSHRILGRVIGLSFILPAAYFVAKRRVTAKMSLGLLAIGAGIGFQGFIGWWMVKSGLQDDLFIAPGSVPRVSQYRLTTHLGAAFAVYSAMLYSGLHILKRWEPIAENHKYIQSLRGFRKATLFVTALVFLTAMTGGLVAGLDAGLIYNEFPYMGLGLTPPAAELWDPFYSHTPEPHPDLYYRNMLENPSTVQLQHRILASTTFVAVLALYAYRRRQVHFSPRMAFAMNSVLAAVSLQVTLGITTLLYLVPLPLAAAHQANSLVLLSTCLLLCSRVFVKPNVISASLKSIGKQAAHVNQTKRVLATAS